MEAIRYAGIHGAHIINISLGQYQDVLPGQSDLAQIVNEVVDKYGVVVVTAAGNTGPGINTVAAPADADSAISVGAFVSPRMWEADFGYQVSQDSLLFQFSRTETDGHGILLSLLLVVPFPLYPAGWKTLIC